MKKQVFRQASIHLKNLNKDPVRRGKAAFAAAAPNNESDDSENVTLPLKLPTTYFKPSEYKGPSYEEVQAIRQKHLSPALVPYYKKPLLVDQAHMQWLYDHQGKRYLDLIGAVCCMSVGHNHPRLVSVLKKQAEKLWLSSNIHLHPKIHEYAEKLTSKLPSHLKVVYFVNSGSEANDMAMLMARMHTGNYDVLSLRSGYHGASPFLMNITSLGNWRYKVPLGGGVLQTMNPDPYRGVWGGAHCKDSVAQTLRSCDCQAGHCEASDKYIDQLESVLRNSTPKQGAVGGIFIEGIQGAAGITQFTKGYVRKAFELVKERGGVCIHDEVQTGFARTGSHYWGFELNDVTPDIVTMAKGIGNGFPLAAVVTTPEIAATMGTATHFNTFGGGALACAVGSEVLDIIDDERLQKNADVVGTYFLKELCKLRDQVDIIGDVRGKGLMIGVEMVTDKDTHNPLPANDFNSLWEDCKDNGLVLGKGGEFLNVFRVQPPLSITKEDVDFAVGTLKQVCINHVK